MFFSPLGRYRHCRTPLKATASPSWRGLQPCFTGWNFCKGRHTSAGQQCNICSRIFVGAVVCFSHSDQYMFHASNLHWLHYGIFVYDVLLFEFLLLYWIVMNFQKFSFRTCRYCWSSRLVLKEIRITFKVGWTLCCVQFVSLKIGATWHAWKLTIKACLCILCIWYYILYIFELFCFDGIIYCGQHFLWYAQRSATQKGAYKVSNITVSTQQAGQVPQEPWQGCAARSTPTCLIPCHPLPGG